MDELITKLKEAAQLRSDIAQQEAMLWQKVSVAFSDYLEQREKLQAQRKAAPENTVPIPDYMNTKEAAKYLGFSKQSLEIWRCHGKGPQYIKLGQSIRYRRQDLDDFAAAHLLPHTAAYKR